MGVQMPDQPGFEIRLPDCQFHRSLSAGAVFGRRRHMVCVGAGAITEHFCNRSGAAPQCVLKVFDNEHAGTLSHDKAISSSIERAGCLCWTVIKARGHGSRSGE